MMSKLTKVYRGNNCVAGLLVKMTLHNNSIWKEYENPPLHTREALRANSNGAMVPPGLGESMWKDTDKYSGCPPSYPKNNVKAYFILTFASLSYVSRDQSFSLENLHYQPIMDFFFFLFLFFFFLLLLLMW